jgi:precorrin-2 dehydrogenase
VTIATTPRFSYPVALDLNDVAVLVVGAGRVAAAKATGLSAAGAAVRVVAPTVSPAMRALLDSGRAHLAARRKYSADDLDGARLVVTATGDAAIDAVVAADATARDLWVNAADQPGSCSFILPAIARNGCLTIAVSTDGASPALARRIRDLVRTVLADEVVALAARLAAARAVVRSAGGSTEDVDWGPPIDAVLPAP